MNRIQLWEPKSEELTAPQDYQIHQATLQASAQGVVQHTLFMPLHYERNYAYPLLIWLHGPGDNESQLKRIMPSISMRNYIAVAPRGTQVLQVQGELQMQGASRSGATWCLTQEDLLQAEQSIFDCIDLVKAKLHISSSCIFLAGHDCGGTMALKIGLSNPDHFAGVLSIGGPLPRGGPALANVDRARHLPLLFAHGRDSRRFPVEKVCDTLRLLHAAGMSITLRQYPCGDEITLQMLSDMNVWIMEQVTGVASSAGDTQFWSSEPN